MTSQDKVIDLTDECENETDSSLKHDRNDQDTQVEGPSKRPKLESKSEAPMSKNKIMALKAKRKEVRKKVNQRKASRTSNHQELKQNYQTLQQDLLDDRKKHHDKDQHLKNEIKLLKNDLASSERAHQVTKDEHENLKLESNEKIVRLEGDLKKSTQAHDGTKKDLATAKEQLKVAESRGATKSEEARKQQQTIETVCKERQDLQSLVDDPVNGLQALHVSCKKMDEDLKTKDARIAALEKDHHDITRQCADLKEAQNEKDAELKTARSIQTDFRNELAKNTEKLISTEQDRDTAKADREKAEKDAEALHRINDENGHRNRGARIREQKAKESLKSVRSEKVELQTKMKDRETELNQTIESLEQKLNASRHQSQRYNYKEPDEKIKKDFAFLEAGIRQFVAKCARPVIDATDQDLKTLWPGWSPELRDFLASPFLCNLVFEAYVWECLVARVFSPESQIWTGELGQSLEKTLRLAGKEAKAFPYKNDHYIDFQYLRSSSSSFIHGLKVEDFLPKYFASDVKAITSTLAKLCGCAITAEMEADAMEIFKDARDFEIQLRMLKPVYGFHTGEVVSGSRELEALKHGFEFSDGNMVDRSPKPSDERPGQTPSVDFITCPGLFKRGNNSGANYDTMTYLVKMGVVCNAEELLLKPGLPTSSRPSSKQTQEAAHSNKVKAEDQGKASAPTTRRGKKAPPTADPGNLEEEETDELHGSATPWAQSTPSRRGSTRGGRGRGGGTPGKKAKASKNRDPDDPEGEYKPGAGTL